MCFKTGYSREAPAVCFSFPDGLHQVGAAPAQTSAIPLSLSDFGFQI